MNLLLLHGAGGVWDEVAYLVVPATAILGVALAILRQQSESDVSAEEANDDADQSAPDADAAGAANVGRRE